MGIPRTGRDRTRLFLSELGRVPALVMGLFAMGMGIDIGLAMVAFLVGALRPGEAQATHDGSGNGMPVSATSRAALLR